MINILQYLFIPSVSDHYFFFKYFFFCLDLKLKGRTTNKACYNRLLKLAMLYIETNIAF